MVTWIGYLVTNQIMGFQAKRPSAGLIMRRRDIETEFFLLGYAAVIFVITMVLLKLPWLVPVPLVAWLVFVGFRVMSFYKLSKPQTR